MSFLSDCPKLRRIWNIFCNLPKISPCRWRRLLLIIFVSCDFGRTGATMSHWKWRKIFCGALNSFLGACLFATCHGILGLVFWNAVLAAQYHISQYLLWRWGSADLVVYSTNQVPSQRCGGSVMFFNLLVNRYDWYSLCLESDNSAPTSIISGPATLGDEGEHS